MTIRRATIGWLTGPLALIAFLGGCASTSERFRPEYRSRTAKVESILLALQPEIAQSFRDGPPYSMTELEGMNAANQLGPEGQDAAILWKQEIDARYRSNREKTLEPLRHEIASYDDAMLEDILAILLPEARNRRWEGLPNTHLRSWSFNATSTARAAHNEALCQSLVSMMGRWANRYPARAPFTFERFNIDSHRIARWCSFPISQNPP